MIGGSTVIQKKCRFNSCGASSMPSPSKGYFAYYSRKMDELRQKHGGCCVMCGAKHSRLGRRKLPLEFAHLKYTGVSGMGRGIARRYHDILKNYITSYVLVCKACHKELDNFAPMVKPADTGDLKSLAEKHVGSSPTRGTI